MSASLHGATVRDVDAQKFVRAFAQHLKRSGKIAVPEWVEYVKTGTHKELAPYDSDWFYTRIGTPFKSYSSHALYIFTNVAVASMARHLYINPDTGVGAFTSLYGGRKRNGVRPAKACRSSGSIARKALQALETLKLVAKGPEGKGRRLTSTGQKQLDQIATMLAKESPSF